jgi:hypothetical protein
MHLKMQSAPDGMKRKPRHGKVCAARNVYVLAKQTNKHDIKKVDQLTLLSTTQKNRGLAISQVQLLVC